MDTVIDEKELDAAGQMADQNENVYEYVHKLDKPFEYEGKTYESIHFNWGKLTGNDALAIENEITAKGSAVVIRPFQGSILSGWHRGPARKVLL